MKRSIRHLGLALAVAGLAGLAAPGPAKADPDAEDIAKALAAIAAIGIGIAAAKNNQWDVDRYGYPFSPAEGVVCLPKPRTCYRNGHFSVRWTQRVFG